MSCEAIIAQMVLGMFKLARSGSSSSWASSLSDYGNRRQKLAAQSQILPFFYVNIEHIDSKMGEIWVVQADFKPI